jgi:hypothetical protein
MSEVRPSKVALIQAKLREAAARRRVKEVEGGEVEGDPPVQEAEIEHVAFIGPAIEESFAETTLLDLLTGPRPTPPSPPRDMNDLYYRMNKLNNGVESLLRTAPDRTCMMAADIRTEMQRVQDRLNVIDAKEAKLKLGPLRLTFKWTGLITAIIILSKVPWLSLLLSIF